MNVLLVTGGGNTKEGFVPRVLTDPEPIKIKAHAKSVAPFVCFHHLIPKKEDGRARSGRTPLCFDPDEYGVWLAEVKGPSA